MNKKLLKIGSILLLISIIFVAIVLFFLFNSQASQVIKADDTGSSQEEIQNLVNTNNQFAFELYHELDKSENSNIFYSPYSIYAALAMTYEGAKEQTADEIKSVFHFPKEDILRPNFAAIYNKINSKNKAYELRTANALWVQKDFPLLENYTQIVEKYYGAKTSNLDFIKENEKSRQEINSFIEKETNNKIKSLIPKGSLSSNTKLVLTNAIYFKGTWEWEFDKSDTREEDFKISPYNTIKTSMMYMKPEKALFNYADLEKLQILEIPYKGEKISMLILLPRQGEDYDLESGEKILSNYTLKDIELSSSKLNEYKSEMKETKLDAIYLPKFEFDTKYFMVDILESLGMPSAFDSNVADFSGMTGRKDLFIGSVIHQAYIKVDEQGSEAAAATVVKMTDSAITPRNIFRADHPFIFIIQERETGNILFLARVNNPNE